MHSPTTWQKATHDASTHLLRNADEFFNVSFDIILKAVEALAAIQSQLAQLVSKGSFVMQVHHPHPVACRLGGIRWANASLGCANLLACRCVPQ